MEGRRIRQKNTLEPTTSFTDIMRLEDGWQFSYPTVVAQKGLTETISDIPHPNYFQRKKNGEIIVGPVDLNRTRISVTDGELSFTHNGWSYSYHGDMSWAMAGSGSAPEPISTLQVANATNQAAIACLKKLHGTKVSSGEYLAEMAKTIKMIRHPFSATADLLGKIRNKAVKVKNAKVAVLRSAQYWEEAFANAWLEYQYGWKPIVMDVNTAIEGFGEAANSMSEERFVARGSATVRGNSNIDWNRLYQGGSLDGMECSGATSMSSDFTASAGVMYCFSSSSDSEVTSRVLGLGSNVLLPLSWNLTPYSFVVDWFVGIGDWLEAANPDPAVRILHSWETRVRRDLARSGGSLSITRVPETQNGHPKTFVGSSGSTVRQVLTYNRTLGLSLPIVPALKLDVSSVSHAISGVSLIAQQLLKNMKGMPVKR